MCICIALFFIPLAPFASLVGLVWVSTNGRTDLPEICGPQRQAVAPGMPRGVRRSASVRTDTGMCYTAGKMWRAFGLVKHETSRTPRPVFVRFSNSQTMLLIRRRSGKSFGSCLLSAIAKVATTSHTKEGTSHPIPFYPCLIEKRIIRSAQKAGSGNTRI